MLYGEHQYNMDPKGRVTVPVKFREELGDTFFICKGKGGYIYMQSREKQAEMEESISNLPSKHAGTMLRVFMGSSIEVEIDKQGRILIPQSLRAHASLNKEVVIAGIGTRAEIWDAGKWNECISEITPEMIEEAIGDIRF